jgi:hypothetical protein
VTLSARSTFSQVTASGRSRGLSAAGCEIATTGEVLALGPGVTRGRRGGASVLLTDLYRLD